MLQNYNYLHHKFYYNLMNHQFKYIYLLLHHKYNDVDPLHMHHNDHHLNHINLMEYKLNYNINIS